MSKKTAIICWVIGLPYCILCILGVIYNKEIPDWLLIPTCIAALSLPHVGCVLAVAAELIITGKVSPQIPNDDWTPMGMP